MSVSTRNAVISAIAFLLSAPLLYAANPSARSQARMVFDSRTQHLVLFGGLTAFDQGAKKSLDLDDTWEWSDRWYQVFPETVPPARSIHVMVYDPVGGRTIMFGGKSGTSFLNDTWAYASGQWTELNPATQPPPRAYAGAAYDRDRNVIVMFGGTVTASDGSAQTNLYDTWEFDGTNWKQVNQSGPQFIKPLLTYDAARHETIMIAEASGTLTPKMFRFDAAAATWNEITGATLPACVNDSQMQFQDTTQTVILTGGICGVVPATSEWDGTAWKTLTPTAAAPFVGGGASAFDSSRGQFIIFGGTLSSGEILPINYYFKDNTWTVITDDTRPGPRSLHVFKGDPNNKVVWMYGGIDEASTLADLWSYVNGSWQRVPFDTTSADTPSSCLTPASSYDTDRQKLVVVCADSTLFEWDGATWKKFANLKPAPPARRFSSMVYDKALKKSVLFGGWDEANYLNQTWTWNGTAWSQVKNKPPTARSNFIMWFDPTMNKTVIYGGVGRVTTLDATTRYSDMWSFDGNGWVNMNATATPGARYGSLYVLDPRSNHLYLFGGLIVQVDGTVQTQKYVNDTWDWDGTKWTQLTTTGAPEPRVNGGFELDPGRDELVLFGGYDGHYLSDVWVFNPATNAWSVRPQSPQQRRRAIH